jgi:hypothetical protein
MTLVLHGPSFNPALPVITPEALAININSELSSFWLPLTGGVVNGPLSATTPPPGDISTRLATTAFVASAVNAGTAGVVTFNNRSGTVTFFLSDVTGVGGAPAFSPTFSGTPTAPTVTPGTDNSTKIATTGFVQSAVAAISSGVISVTAGNGLTGGGTGVVSVALAATLPNGTRAQTMAPGDNTTSIATTQFVSAAVTGGTAGVSTFNGRPGAVVLLTADIAALDLRTLPTSDPGSGKVWINGGGGSSGALWVGPP